MCRKHFSPGSSTVNPIVRSLCSKNDISVALLFCKTKVKKHEAMLQKENYAGLMRRLRCSINLLNVFSNYLILCARYLCSLSWIYYFTSETILSNYVISVAHRLTVVVSWILQIWHPNSILKDAVMIFIKHRLIMVKCFIDGIRAFKPC